MERGQKYNSFYDKIKDYQLRKLQLERNAGKKQAAGKYSKEYYALIKARKDIKDKIKESIEGALIFSENIRADELTEDTEEVREEISDEATEFVRDIFNEKIVSRLLDAIFFHGYRRKNKEYFFDEKSKNYRLNVARQMCKMAIGEMKWNIDPKYYGVLSQDLTRATEICDAIAGVPRNEKIKTFLKKIHNK